jgi:hypothetical protein
MLWPIAWIWAYTRPVAYRAAYGTDKHEDYYREHAEKAKDGSLLASEIDHLRGELDSMASRGQLPPELKALRDDLETLRAPKENGAA